MKYSFIISTDEINLRLDQAIARRLPEHSRTEIKTWIEAGHILLNQAKTSPKTKLKGGEEIEVNTIEKNPINYSAQPIPLHILYEDDSLLVINKPVGMVVHPGAGNNDQTLLNALLYYLPSLNMLPRAGILHRLDKDTSGLLMVAKTEQAYKHLTHQLKKRTIVREYEALVVGSFVSGGTINAPINRHHTERTHMAVSEDGKPAITHYRILEKYRSYTRLTVRLETGRTHQIRVHMAYIRHPIVGDKTYGKRFTIAKNMSAEAIAALRGASHQMLHAKRLEFVHPKTHIVQEVVAPIPDDMQELITILREDSKRKI